MNAGTNDRAAGGPEVRRDRPASVYPFADIAQRFVEAGVRSSRRFPRGAGECAGGRIRDRSGAGRALLAAGGGQADYGDIGSTLVSSHGTYSVLAGVKVPIYAGGRA